MLIPDSNIVPQEEEVVDNRNVIQHYVVSAEPTLYRSRRQKCPKCGQKDTKFFLLTTRSGKPAGRSYICCNSDCLHRFWDDDTWIDDYEN
ncbi:PREDICTED: DNA-directed RNA polymerases II, IV and V subunit 9A-like [Ipomoea nil]|uniref:DNA-directed RNA polymerases II, IV and V subunit 9A-like n=1 Tax=Ipomoea nil TaxID=35883 RepID=UPI0009009403|nr:PREDICTED: DNA-directed RNA polymerases II, IV and V subunit 9A-like [Ipomoea nil]